MENVNNSSTTILPPTEIPEFQEIAETTADPSEDLIVMGILRQVKYYTAHYHFSNKNFILLLPNSVFTKLRTVD